MNIFGKLLTPERTLCKISGNSKKRIFEVLAETFDSDSSMIPAREVYEHLLARERLGSTGLGMGVAIPHCRAESCVNPVGVLATLDNGLEFDSPDGKPVNLLFALIVPHEEHQNHLDILAEVAKLFSYEKFCERLRSTSDPCEMYQMSIKWKPHK